MLFPVVVFLVSRFTAGFITQSILSQDVSYAVLSVVSSDLVTLFKKVFLKASTSITTVSISVAVLAVFKRELCTVPVFSWVTFLTSCCLGSVPPPRCLNCGLVLRAVGFGGRGFCQ